MHNTHGWHIKLIEYSKEAQHHAALDRQQVQLLTAVLCSSNTEHHKFYVEKPIIEMLRPAVYCFSGEFPFGSSPIPCLAGLARTTEAINNSLHPSPSVRGALHDKIGR